MVGASRAATLALLALAVAGCGGSASSPTPTGPLVSAPPPSASAAPTPSAAPSPTPSVDVTLFQPAPAVEIADASTEFDDPSELEGWRVSQGEPMDGGMTSFAVDGGVLRIEAAQSEWIDRVHGASVGRTISGNVVVTVRVLATGADGGLPAVPWSLAGVLLRAPTTDPAVENWVHWSAGALGDWRIERKSTRGGRSELELISVPAGWVELRILRHGRTIVLLHRPDGGAWTLDHQYDRPDLPDSLELLLTAQTGGESDRGDLVASFDWLHVASSSVPPELAALLEAGRRPDTQALLAALGD